MSLPREEKPSDAGTEVLEALWKSVRGHPRAVAASLALLLGILLFATAIPGVFTVDEDNYLVTVLGIREGRLTVPGTEGLPASNELLYFDPALHVTGVSSTPVTWRTPPLYGIIAQPFAALGFSGLLLMNSLAFGALAFLVWSYARQRCRQSGTPWVAAILLVFGSFLIEYAQGAWPHALCALLGFGAFYVAALVRRGSSPLVAIASGVLVGIAAGVRYQNAVLAATIGLGLVLVPKRRLAALSSFAAGLVLVLALTAALNHARLGSWNPVSKGSSYLTVAPQGQTGDARGGNALATFWGRTVDHRAYPALDPARAMINPYLERDPATGTVSIAGALKKSWVQSMPWVGLTLLLVAWATFPAGLRAFFGRLLGSGKKGADATDAEAMSGDVRRELAASAAAVFPVLAVFSWAGSARLDGYCFNQRYFIELIPIVACALALALDRFPVRWPPVAAGTVCAFLLALVSRSAADHRLQLLSVIPLVLAGIFCLGWAAAVWTRRSWALWAAAGLTIGWGFGVHLLDDLRASRELREANLHNAEFLDARLPKRAAVFAWWGAKDALGPLQLDRDLVVLDAWADQGKSAVELTEAFLRSGRPVFVLTPGFPPKLILQMAEGKRVRTRDPVQPGVNPPLIEIVKVPGG